MRSESGTGVGCHAGLFPTARRPQSTTPEATQEESPSQPPEESSTTRPQQQMTSPEAPEASPEQANQDWTAPRSGGTYGLRSLFIGDSDAAIQTHLKGVHMSLEDSVALLRRCLPFHCLCSGQKRKGDDMSLFYLGCY
ncbi:hypothetical protein HPB50_007115 [Hyalomma asiaticum]|uniref:Uncharacterized protein n=1 Tax=Hyalomma asiaticum TaxID=266040 RepID=A0ACB7RQS5_HYAAI|nr:hypothetical protein HPB50_007115 [Hyalomma asiaticum]